MQRVLFHIDPSPRLAADLAAVADTGLDVTCVAPGDHERFRAALPRADVLWHVLEPVTADHLAVAPRLRLIQKIGVGVNTIDLDAAQARGIAVCNMPGTNTTAVAELTLLLMLACLRRVVALDRLTRSGEGWLRSAAETDRFGELGGRTVGLIGFGAVPRRLAPVLTALGALVRYWTPEPKPDAGAEWRPLDELLTESDVVSLHVPLVPATERLLDAAAFARMRRGAVLVNTARGGLVDEAALIAALDSGRLAAAGLDVFATEPLPVDSPLVGRDDVVLTPHVAWLTPETLTRSLTVAVENTRRIADGRPLLHRVV